MHDLSLHILDLIENSLRAGSKVIAIELALDESADLLTLQVEDDGEGIGAAPELVLNPFYTTHRSKKVGLGLSLFKAAAERAAGGLTLGRSRELGGVAVVATMGLTHIDRPPLGDLAETIAAMILTHPAVDFRLSIRMAQQAHAFRLSEFAAGSGLDARSNVRLASTACAAIRAVLQPWQRCAWAAWLGRWQATARPLCVAGSNQLEQGVNA